MALALVHDRQLPKIPPKQHIMFLHDDIKWGWTSRELTIFRRMWAAGINLWKMAERMKRDPDEIALLVIDQIRQGEIRQRPGGMEGKG